MNIYKHNQTYSWITLEKDIQSNVTCWQGPYVICATITGIWKSVWLVVIRNDKHVWPKHVRSHQLLNTVRTLWHLCWKIAENVVPAQSFLLMSLQVNAFDRSRSSFYQVEGGCPAQSCKLRCTGSMNCKLPKWSLCRKTGETSCLSMYLTSWKQFPSTPDFVPAVQLISADKVINYL